MRVCSCCGLSKIASAVLRRFADRDGDGAAGLFGGGDCNDRDRTIGPAESEILDDGIDQDCSGEDLTAGRLRDLAPKPPPEPAVPTSKLRPDLNVVLITVDTLRADGYTRATWWVRATDDPLRGFLTGAGWAADGAHTEVGGEDEESGVKFVRLHTDISA